MLVIGSSCTLSKLPKIGIIGASGFIGRHLMKAWSERSTVIGTSRAGSNRFAPLDLNEKNWDLQSFKALDWVLVLAARSRIVDCETHPATAWTVNCDHTVILAQRLLEMGLHVAFASTDYVFDGQVGKYTEESPENPIVVYGKTKFRAEQRLRELSDKILIVGLSKVYGLEPGETSLLTEMAQAFQQGQTVRAAFDQILNPIWESDLAKILAFLICNELSGTWHVCGDETLSRLEIAQKVAASFGCPQLVKAISLDELGSPVRPKNTSMSNRKLRGIFPDPMRSLNDTIRSLAHV